MIEIIDKTNSNRQELLNLLATCREWAQVVYDETTPENVTQLWVT